MFCNSHWNKTFVLFEEPKAILIFDLGQTTKEGIQSSYEDSIDSFETQQKIDLQKKQQQQLQEIPENLDDFCLTAAQEPENEEQVQEFDFDASKSSYGGKWRGESDAGKSVFRYS